MARARLLLQAAILAGGVVCAGGDEMGADLAAVFARASAGAPVSAVAIGGSITQAGGGWVEAWLKQTFPDSAVVMRNAGMSAAGSDLGMFRLGRDVIAAQPDLVLIEYAVNDGGRAEEDVIWTVESCVRRLKSLPHPPAIVMLETAHRQRPVASVPPQRKVAEHYGLVSIDLNAAVRDKIEKDSLKWEDLLSDDVHMNDRGNAFYAETIAAVLEKFLSGKPVAATAAPLPPPLSPWPLIMNGSLASVPLAEGWSKEPSIPDWWDMFFLGAASCKTSGKVLEIPFRGTTGGLFYALDESYGVMYASVDGARPELLACNNRKGYTYSILGRNLPPGEHLLRIVLPKDGAGAEGVKLGYVMTGGDVSVVPPAQIAKGSYDAAKMATLALGAVTSTNWGWSGPFGDVSKPWPVDDPTLPNLHAVFWPESRFEDGAPASHAPADGDPWKKIEKNSPVVSFSTLTGFRDRGVYYAWTVMEADAPITLDSELALDYWGKIWVNGALAGEIKEHSGSPEKPFPIPLPLKAGKNHVLVKVHSGSLGCMFSLRMPECPATVRFLCPIGTD